MYSLDTQKSTIKTKSLFLLKKNIVVSADIKFAPYSSSISYTDPNHVSHQSLNSSKVLESKTSLTILMSSADNRQEKEFFHQDSYHGVQSTSQESLMPTIISTESLPTTPTS